MNTQADSTSRDLMIKVPAVITLWFWIIKILATTVGETGADFLIFNWNLGLGSTSLLMSILLVLFLAIQVRARTYIPWLYWMAVVFVSIVGTLITDNLTDNLGVPLEVTTITFAIALIITFALWYISEKSLSIHSIYTVKRELYYWAAILFTFALGTAAGDYLAETMALGFANSAWVFAAAIAAVVVAYMAFRLNAVVAFWLAYILTRPLGASLGDLLSQPVADGGLGLGTVNTSAVFLMAILVLVSLLTITRLDSASTAPQAELAEEWDDES